MNSNQKVPPKIFIRSTGVSIKKPVTLSASTPQNGDQRKVFVVKNKSILPAAGITKKVQQHVPTGEATKLEVNRQHQVLGGIKEIKEEPLDDDTPGGIANITGSAPINLSDLMKTALPPSTAKPSTSSAIDEMTVEQKMSLEKVHPSCQASDIASALNQNFLKYNAESASQKRTRKPTRHYDYVYDQSTIQNEAEDDNMYELVAKQSKMHDDGCRCEYIVPELERKMDRIMDKMHFIETLAKSMLSKDNQNAIERNTELIAAQNEIQQLRRQLIIQRNQKVLNKPET
ncbi:unnamed protein product [Caenorhabditis brenneri]